MMRVLSIVIAVSVTAAACHSEGPGLVSDAGLADAPSSDADPVDRTDGQVRFDGGDSPDAIGGDDGNRADLPAGRCGDGVRDRRVDPSTGWFVEECDSGPGNGEFADSCGSDCRYARCGPQRPCGPLRSTFAAYMPSDDGDIRDFYLKMRRDGYEEVIFVNVGGQEWTKSGGTWSPTGEQLGFVDRSSGPSPLQRHLAIAEQAGVDVVVGLGGIIPTGGFDWEVWMSAQARGEFVTWNLDLAAEVDRQVGDSPAFAGYYLSQETDLGNAGQCQAAGDYYAAMIAGAGGLDGVRRLAGSLQIVVAPYLAVGSQAPATTGQNLRCLYDRLEAAGGIDRILVQDGVPKEAEGFTSLQNVGAHFQAMAEALPAGDRETLGVDLETYAWPDGECFLSRPADLDRIAGQVREVGRWVGGFSQWIHAHNFTAAGLGQDDCDAERRALGQAYRDQPFAFHSFLYDGRVILRGYYLLPGGTAGIACDTAGGRQTFTYDDGDGAQVHYAPDWLSEADVPDVDEVFEVSFPAPAECTGGRVAWFVNPDGTASAQLPF